MRVVDAPPCLVRHRSCGSAGGGCVIRRHERPRGALRAGLTRYRRRALVLPVGVKRPVVGRERIAGAIPARERGTGWSQRHDGRNQKSPRAGYRPCCHNLLLPGCLRPRAETASLRSSRPAPCGSVSAVPATWPSECVGTDSSLGVGRNLQANVPAPDGTRHASSPMISKARAGHREAACAAGGPAERCADTFLASCTRLAPRPNREPWTFKGQTRRCFG